eukprot:355040-Chlamydomonas_euryale.AAC.22
MEDGRGEGVRTVKSSKERLRLRLTARLKWYQRVVIDTGVTMTRGKRDRAGWGFPGAKKRFVPGPHKRRACAGMLHSRQGRPGA